MELSGRPLFDNPVDAALFVERDEEREIAANCRDGVNTLLLGDRGMGKTSLLRHVLFRLREEEFPAVGVDAGSAEGTHDLIRLIAAALGRRFHLPAHEFDARNLGEARAVLHELRLLRPEEPPARHRTAILLDLPAAVKEVHQLFGRFRDELWQLPFTWIVAAPDELRVELLTPPADAFFEEVIQLRPLTTQQQQQLIDLRLDPRERVFRWEPEADGEPNPRRLLEVVRESVRTGDVVVERLKARFDRASELVALGPSATRVYDDLEENGPASASDPEFLERLGWSRQRAATVLGQLEDRDFVRADFRPSRGGRPRKVFSIVPPAS
jgi:Cdc6-like AAA superfamily ATPase